MGYEKRVWNLGRVIEVEERHTYRWPQPGKRQKKEKPTSEAVKRNNQRNAARKRRMQLEMYFNENDCYMTLTYPKTARPETIKECQKDWKDLIGKVRKIFRRNGAALYWIRNIEKGTKGAFHIHAVVKELPAGSTDKDGNPLTVAKLIQRIWQNDMGYGRVDSQYLQADVAALAEYITKTPLSSRGTGHQAAESNCSASRNMPLPAPDVKTYTRRRTFEGKDIKVPKGFALVKDSVIERENPFNGFLHREYRFICLDSNRRRC